MSEKIDAVKINQLSPVKSFLVSLSNFIACRNSFPEDYNGQKLRMKDGAEFEIFRHVIVGNKQSLLNEKGAVFIVRFKLSKMSVEKNKRFSRFPIPMFIGLPGFRAKFWMCDSNTGFNQGIYQWETEQDAINYSKSFAVDFMAKRSDANSISFEIVPTENIYKYIDKHRVNDNVHEEKYENLG